VHISSPQLYRDTGRMLCIALLLSGCTMYRYTTRSVADAEINRDMNIRGISTAAGERIMFSPVEMENRSLALIRNDTLYAHVDWRGWCLPLAEIDSLHIRLRDRRNSTALTAVTVAAGLYAAIVIYPETAFVGCDPEGRRVPPYVP